ncbi:GNAT family N-acetyltransferase [Glacieibacterium sp.]|uniref:GNAT family N-acetyltransferase n=1 Tax=Glacieibacterium sp. TaxID=2860237 RepID=UPI003B00A481
MLVRVATPTDLPALQAMITRAIMQLQSPFLEPEQVAASATMMGLDTQLVDDGTYLVADLDGAMAACGGWSKRATSYGGDHSPGRSARLLDPDTEPTRIRAMYTDPAFVRRGLGRLMLAACEDAARAAGFREATMVATMAGLPLYLACGYVSVEAFEDRNGAVAVPLVHMRKPLI